MRVSGGVRSADYTRSTSESNTRTLAQFAFISAMNRLWRVVVLIGVVGGPVGEDDVQGDIEVAVVDVAGQVRLRLPQAKNTMPG